MHIKCDVCNYAHIGPKILQICGECIKKIYDDKKFPTISLNNTIKKIIEDNKK